MNELGHPYPLPLQDRDNRRVCQAINWKGCLQDDDDNKVKTTDEEFKHFYEDLRGTATSSHVDQCRDVTVSIPVLDDLISPGEVSAQVDHIKADEACGPDGIPPGVFKLLPVQWLMIITSLFSTIFATAQHPTSWTKPKFSTIFQKGDRKDTQRTQRTIEALV